MAEFKRRILYFLHADLKKTHGRTDIRCLTIGTSRLQVLNNRTSQSRRRFCRRRRDRSCPFFRLYATLSRLSRSLTIDIYTCRYNSGSLYRASTFTFFFFFFLYVCTKRVFETFEYIIKLVAGARVRDVKGSLEVSTRTTC